MLVDVGVEDELLSGDGRRSSNAILATVRKSAPIQRESCGPRRNGYQVAWLSRGIGDVLGQVMLLIKKWSKLKIRASARQPRQQARQTVDDATLFLFRILLCEAEKALINRAV